LFYKSAHKGPVPLSYFTKFGVREGSPRSALTPNLTVVAFKIWAYRPKIAKFGNFWYKFAPKGYTP